LTIAILLLMHYLLSQTRYGQHIYAIGGNVNAALRAGINVRNNTIALYVLSSLTAGCAGILYTAKFSAGAAQAGEPVLLDSIAAVVIGGASLFGGSGTVIGTVIGALIIAVIQYGLVFVNVEPFWQFVAVGVVSYGIYLWHFPVFVAVQYLGGGWGAAMRVVVAAFATAAFTVLSWRFVERPFLGLKQRFDGRGRTQAGDDPALSRSERAP